MNEYKFKDPAEGRIPLMHFIKCVIGAAGGFCEDSIVCVHRPQSRATYTYITTKFRSFNGNFWSFLHKCISEVRDYR